MLKVLYFTSETKKKFGIYKVVNILKNTQNKKFKVRFSQKVVDIFFFKPNIIHIHGCWRPRLILAFLLAKILFKKIVISPHGMIDPFSFSQKKIKKNIAWYLYQKHMFTFSNLIIVNSQSEKKNLAKKFKILNNIIIIKHGVHIPNILIKKRKTGELKFVFYSRIHPSKNLTNLIEIWKQNTFFNSFNLDIYGEVDDNKYFFKLKNNIQNAKNITYKGTIKNKLVNKLSNYDIFLHPSKSENFGLVILEAMSCGLFPVVNKKLDWKILDKNNLGCSVNFNYLNLRKIIIKLNNSKNKIRNKSFRKNVTIFLRENYNWNQIILDYYKNYLKIIT